ncbi:MAG: hypothetical protein ACJAUH_002094 [Saprospiraceae bacterium]|jgi:hypothetical protein
MQKQDNILNKLVVQNNLVRLPLTEVIISFPDTTGIFSKRSVSNFIELKS